METIFDVAENSKEEFPTADEAELQLIKEVRKLGAESLETWALSQGKKLNWHSTFGKITVVVQRFLLDRICQTPFSDISGGICSQLFLPLQRAITDFSAEV